MFFDKIIEKILNKKLPKNFSSVLDITHGFGTKTPKVRFGTVERSYLKTDFSF